MFKCLSNGELISASKALPRHGGYTCPKCLDELVLCKGKSKQPFFRHLHHTECVYTNYAPADDVVEVSELDQLKDNLRVATLNHKKAKLEYDLAMVNAKLM